MTIRISDFERITIQQIKENDETTEFDCEDNDLNEFLKKESIIYKNQYIANTFLVFYDRYLVGFFSLLNDAIKLKQEERKMSERLENLGEYPAIKIGRIGIDKKWKRKGFGTFIINAVIALSRNINQKTACRFITVDTYQESILFYEKQRFIRNQRYTRKRKYISMRFDLLEKLENS